MGILNRRNAVLGWGVWQVAKRAATRKAKKVKPSRSRGRTRALASAGAATAAATIGGLAFWRKRKSATTKS